MSLTGISNQLTTFMVSSRLVMPEAIVGRRGCRDGIWDILGVRLGHDPIFAPCPATLSLSKGDRRSFSMKIISHIIDMQRWSEARRLEGKKIALVPTMGFLHEGHLSLVREGKKRGDVVIVSIFVNPMQFNQQADFATYPRSLEQDQRMLEGVGTDVLFYPEAQEIYPRGFQTAVEVDKVSQPLCGAFRPGHFRGVATVVAKLFNITKPHVALFGEKDFQQCVVITRMVKDLNFDLEVLAMPTVREPDGLAMSSRNARLSPAEWQTSLCLSRALSRAQA